MAARRDLPARPWFEDAGLEARLDAAKAPAELRRFVLELAEAGVARLDLGEEGRKLCRAAADDVERHFTRKGVARVQDAWLRSGAVRRLAAHPLVLQALELAYGRRPFPFQTLNFRHGSQQPLHSDAMHFHSVPERFMCGVWTALEDVSPEAGPLRYRPGSHRLPVITPRLAGIDPAGAPSQDYERLYLPAIARQLDEAGLPITEAVLRQGEVLVWAANLAHGGAPIADPRRTRRSLVTHFFFEDCLYYTPFDSDVEASRFALRLPADVARGGVRWPRRNGAVAVPPLRAVAGAVAKLALRRIVA